MPQKTEKAGPVAGTDLRKNADLAIASEPIPAHQELQARELTRRAALSLTTAIALAPFVFGEGGD